VPIANNIRAIAGSSTRLLPIVALAVWLTTKPASADATVNWQSTTDQLARQVLDRSNVISDFTNLISEHFKSSTRIDLDNLRVTINNDSVPHINPDTTEIILPYSYLTHAIKSHAELEETKEAAFDRALDTIEYTLYHLAGHLIVANNSAESDDAAEAISSWIMIRGFSNGGEQWFNNVEAFGRASQLLDGPLQDYWHEHSLYKSRQNKINCWILGSAPEQYENLLKPVLKPEERKAQCVNEWQMLDSQMQTELQAELKAQSTLTGN